MVPVHHRTQIGQLIMAGRHKAFPNGTFRHFAVAHHRIDAAFSVLLPAGQCHTHAHRQTMSQRTGVHLDSRQLIIRMSNELGTELRELVDHRLRLEESLRRQHCIIAFHGMPLTHNEIISVRIVLVLRAYIHLVKVQCYKRIHNRKITADMAAAGFHDHIQHHLAKFEGFYCQCFCIKFLFIHYCLHSSYAA